MSCAIEAKKTLVISVTLLKIQGAGQKYNKETSEDDFDQEIVDCKHACYFNIKNIEIIACAI